MSRDMISVAGWAKRRDRRGFAPPVWVAGVGVALLAGCAAAPAPRARPATPVTSAPSSMPVARPPDRPVTSVPPAAVAPTPRGPSLDATPPEMIAADARDDGGVPVESVSVTVSSVPAHMRTVAMPVTFTEPRPVRPIFVVYPEAARRHGQQGTVELEVAVEKTGEVSSARIVTSSGVPALDEAARLALSLSRFEPARRNNTPVAHTFRQSVRFVLTSSP